MKILCLFGERKTGKSLEFGVSLTLIGQIHWPTLLDAKNSQTMNSEFHFSNLVSKHNNNMKYLRVKYTLCVCIYLMHDVIKYVYLLLYTCRMILNVQRLNNVAVSNYNVSFEARGY